MQSYSRAKLCNIFFTFELQRRLKEEVQVIIHNLYLIVFAPPGTNTTQCYTLHPGCVYTNIWVWPAPKFAKPIMNPIYECVAWVLMRTSKRACGLILCAANKNCKGGIYYIGCRPVKPSSLALDTEFAVEAWDKSEEMIAPISNKPTSFLTTNVCDTPSPNNKQQNSHQGHRSRQSINEQQQREPPAPKSEKKGGGWYLFAPSYPISFFSLTTFQATP